MKLPNYTVSPFDSGTSSYRLPSHQIGSPCAHSKTFWMISLISNKSSLVATSFNERIYITSSLPLSAYINRLRKLPMPFVARIALRIWSMLVLACVTSVVQGISDMFAVLVIFSAKQRGDLIESGGAQGAEVLRQAKKRPNTIPLFAKNIKNT